MSRPKGLAKTGGRKPGTPNRRTLVLADHLVELGFNPVAELADLARGERLTAKDRADICLELLSYLFPKRKPSDEHCSADKGPTPEVVYVAQWGNHAPG